MSDTESFTVWVIFCLKLLSTLFGCGFTEMQLLSNDTLEIQVFAQIASLELLECG